MLNSLQSLITLKIIHHKNNNSYCVLYIPAYYQIKSTEQQKYNPKYYNDFYSLCTVCITLSKARIFVCGWLWPFIVGNTVCFIYMLEFNGGRDLMNEFHFCKVSTLETAKPHNCISPSHAYARITEWHIHVHRG